jgi:TonB family protein
VDGKPVSVVTKIDLEYTVPLPPGQGIAGVAGMSGMGAVDTVAPISARPDPVLKTASPDSVKVPSDVLRALKYAETTVPYPSGAQGSGYVVLKVLISKTGTVQETTVISGDQDIQQAAMDGVKAWKYRPYLVDSEPREVQSTIAILFAGKGIAGVESPYGSPAGNGSATLASVFGGPPPIVARRPQMPGAPVRVASGTVAGMILSRPDPVYPAIAKAAHVQGEVVLHAIISKEGMIENLTAVSGPPMLVPSALEAVAKWRYKPYLLNGEPTKVDTTITVNFTFGGPDSPAAPAAAPSAPLSDP